MVEVSYNKKRGQDQKPNETVDLEQFITVKGIKALGNQFTADKIKQIDHLEPLPYELAEPEQPSEIEVVDEKEIGKKGIDLNTDDLGADGEQASLF